MILSTKKLNDDIFAIVTDGAFSKVGYYVSKNTNLLDELKPVLDFTTPGGIVFDGWSTSYPAAQNKKLLFQKNKPNDSNLKYLKTLGFDTFNYWHKNWTVDEVMDACIEGYRLAKLAQNNNPQKCHIKNKKTGTYLQLDNIYINWVDSEHAGTFHILDNQIKTKSRIQNLICGKTNQQENKNIELEVIPI